MLLLPKLKHPRAEDKGVDPEKRNAWQDLNLTVVAPSTWISEQARSSFPFRERRVETIPTGVDLEAFEPVDQESARRCRYTGREKLYFWGVRPNKRPSKGYKQLLEALETLAHSELANDIIAITFGAYQRFQ